MCAIFHPQPATTSRSEALAPGNPCAITLPYPERPVEAVYCRAVPRCALRRRRHAAGRAGRKCRLYFLFTAVEAAIQASGLTFTFLRPNLYMQGLLNFRQSIQEQSAFFAAAGDARISAVDVRDLADVAVAALTTSQHDNKHACLIPHSD